jgi:hypothetical protein
MFKILTSLLDKGAQTCVRRVMVLGAVQLASSRDVAVKNEDVDVKTKRRYERSCVRTREQVKNRYEIEIA